MSQLDLNKIEITIGDYKKLIENNHSYEILYNAIYNSMEYDKFRFGDCYIRINDKKILEVIKALDAETFYKYEKELINNNKEE